MIPLFFNFLIFLSLYLFLSIINDVYFSSAAYRGRHRFKLFSVNLVNIENHTRSKLTAVDISFTIYLEATELAQNDKQCDAYLSVMMNDCIIVKSF